MGVSLSTARIIAPTSFLYDFVAQQYGMFSSPNMKDIHDAHLSFFSPQPFFIAGFFFPQQIFQVIWLYRLWNKKEADLSGSTVTAQAGRGMRDFAPIYALGNVCIGTWMFFWNKGDLATSNIFVIINTVAQLAYVTTQLGPLNTKSWDSILTHVVAKTFAGIGVLDLLHNTSVAYFQDQMPSTLVKALTGVGFVGAGFMSDWIFGGCLVYDLIALSVGQASYDQGWSKMLAGFAVATAGAIGLKNWFRPPYISQDEGYERAAGEDTDVV